MAPRVASTDPATDTSVSGCPRARHCQNDAPQDFFFRGNFQPIVHRYPWSTPATMRCSRPRSLTFAINRYYDPTTDQFLSIDPRVDRSGQPYAFAKDEPLNLTDSLGSYATSGDTTSGPRESAFTLPAPIFGITPVVQVASESTTIWTPWGTYTLTLTTSVSGTYRNGNVQVYSDGNVSVNINGGSATFSPDSGLGYAETIGSLQLQLGIGGTSATWSQTSHVGGDTVTTSYELTANTYNSGSGGFTLTPTEQLVPVGLEVVATIVAWCSNPATGWTCVLAGS